VTYPYPAKKYLKSRAVARSSSHDVPFAGANAAATARLLDGRLRFRLLALERALANSVRFGRVYD
jgi:hypothetical protein